MFLAQFVITWQQVVSRSWGEGDSNNLGSLCQLCQLSNFGDSQPGANREEAIHRQQKTKQTDKQKQTNKQLAINTNTYEEHSRPLGRGKYHLAVIMTLENKTSIKWM